MTHPIKVLIAAATLTFGLAAPTAAQADDGRYSARVQYADLNLNSAAGADAIINRLQGAALESCGDRMGRMSLAEHRDIRRCARAFVQKGVVRLENANVAQRYVERGGRLPAVTIAAM